MLPKLILLSADLLSGRITARKCWELLFTTIERIDVGKLDEFVNQMKIDPDISSVS